MNVLRVTFLVMALLSGVARGDGLGHGIDIERDEGESQDRRLFLESSKALIGIPHGEQTGGERGSENILPATVVFETTGVGGGGVLHKQCSVCE